MRTIDAALRYINHGWPIHPIKADPSKRPLTDHGFQDATTDPEQIRKWWMRWPEANIGMATGKQAGVFVIDIDNIEAHRTDGFAVWRDLCLLNDWQTYSNVLSVATPSGGMHLYFNYVDGITNARGKLPLGLDVRGQGGYVLLPPSEIRSKKYSWIYPHATEAMNAPRWLIDMITARATATPSTGTPPHTISADRPSIIDSYNRATNIRDLLSHYGYTIEGNKFTRPGKSPKDGISGTIRDETNSAYTFSANDPAYIASDLSPSGAGCTLKPFDVLARLSFANDAKAACLYLRSNQ